MARPHFSSSGQKAAEAGSDFDCLVCRKVHSKETHDTIRMVILSDSLLFKAYLDEKPETHIDSIAYSLLLSSPIANAVRR